MSFFDLLKSIEGSIGRASPHIGAIETAVNDVLEVGATVFPSAAPVVAAIEGIESVAHHLLDTTSQTVAALSDAATSVQTQIEAARDGATIDATAAPAVDPINDPASAAAGSIAASESTSIEDVVQRLMALEQAIVQLLPLFAKIGKELGL